MASGHLIEVGHLIVNTENYKHVGKNFDGLTVIYDLQTTPRWSFGVNGTD